MTREQIEAYFADKEQLLVDAVSRLVAIDSVEGKPAPGAPFGPGPAAALDEALAIAREWGLTAENHEGYVGTADLNGNEDALHILGHLDVVAPGEGWTVTPPYSPKLVDGLLYGRGTDDDKGPVAASLLAMKAVKDLGVPLSKNCKVIMGTNEESGSGDIAWYFARHPFAPATFSPDAGFPVINTEKGGFRPTFTKSWPAQTELPRVAWLHGGIRSNILPGEASAGVEGLTMYDIQPVARNITARTGIKFTFAHENGATVIKAKGENSHAAHPEGGNNAITGLISLLCALPLAEAAQVGAAVQRRPDQPGFQMFPVPAAALLLQQPEEHVLIDILRVGGGPRHGQGQAVDRVLILLEQPQGIIHTENLLSVRVLCCFWFHSPMCPSPPFPALRKALSGECRP